VADADASDRLQTAPPRLRGDSRLPMSKKLVSQANVLVIGVLVALIALIGLTTWDRFSATRSAREWTLHTYDVLGSIRELEISVRDAENDERGYLLTGHDDFRSSHDEAMRRSVSLLGDLKRLTADNVAQQMRLHDLASAWELRSQQFAQAIQTRQNNGLEGLLGLMGSTTGRQTMTAI
jgi:CHASE3 domain sensor protein